MFKNIGKNDSAVVIYNRWCECASFVDVRNTNARYLLHRLAAVFRGVTGVHEPKMSELSEGGYFSIKYEWAGYFGVARGRRTKANAMEEAAQNLIESVIGHLGTRDHLYEFRKLLVDAKEESKRLDMRERIILCPWCHEAKNSRATREHIRMSHLGGQSCDWGRDHANHTGGLSMARTSASTSASPSVGVHGGSTGGSSGSGNGPCGSGNDSNGSGDGSRGSGNNSNVNGSSGQALTFSQANAAYEAANKIEELKKELAAERSKAKEAETAHNREMENLKSQLEKAKQGEVVYNREVESLKDQLLKALAKADEAENQVRIEKHSSRAKERSWEAAEGKRRAQFASLDSKMRDVFQTAKALAK